MHSHYMAKRQTDCRKGLNPCFNGRCTRTHHLEDVEDFYKKVLILVLMEDALAQVQTLLPASSVLQVLILVLMEDALARSNRNSNTS